MTAPNLSRAEPRHELPSRDADGGLITLEWLLIVGAIAGLAASSVLIVQRVLDDTSEVPTDPLVRLLQADVEAAFVAAEAQSVFDDNPALYVPGSPIDMDFRDRCQNDIQGAFSDVLDRLDWTSPDNNGTPTILADDEPAMCVATPKRNLGA